VGVGQADISGMFQYKSCGKIVGNVNVAGVEVDATRDVPVSDWFVTVDTTNMRLGYLLQAPSSVTIDWYIQTANDTHRPDEPASLGLTQVQGPGANSYTSNNTGDVDISAFTVPAATSTPAYARIMARLSASSASSIDQLVANVQVS